MASPRPMRNLRIAMMIESDGPGGAEMMVYQLSEQLRSRGHSIVPVGPRNGTGWMSDLFRNAGFSPQTFWLERPIDPSGVRRLVTLLRSHSVDFVHSHEFTMAVYGSVAARVVKVPHLITMHGGLTVTKALRRRIALRWAMRQSGRTVAVSNATRQEFARDLGVPDTSFSVVHNGVLLKPGNAERVRGELRCRPGDLVILAVGNLERNKNHRMILEALAQLEDDGLEVPWKVVIAGGRGGEEHQHLLEYTRARAWEERVHILTGRNDIADLQALAEIFVMPSLWEGLPLAVLEAMLAGKAIIASDTGGIPEAITNGRDGILVPPGDRHALAAALRALLTDPVRRQELAKAALARGREEFTVDVMTDRYVTHYSSILGGKR